MLRSILSSRAAGRWSLAALMAIIGLLPSDAHAGQRHALLIANQAYERGIGALENPEGDIRLIRSALLAAGFAADDIATARNRTRPELLAAVDAFAERLSAAGEDAVGLFYYSGHGIAKPDSRENFLIPVDAKRFDRTIWYSSVKLETITEALSNRAPHAAHIVIFDACRNELKLPVRGTKGFMPMAEQPGMLIAFSTAPGMTASDAGEGSGPYAAALAGELVKVGLDHLDLFHNVKERVLRTTREAQQPWVRDGLRHRVFLAGLPLKKTSLESAPAAPQMEIASAAPATPSQPAATPLCIVADASALKGDDAQCLLAGSGTPARDRLQDGRACPACPELVAVPAGAYQDPSDTSLSPRSVRFAQPFWISRYEISFAEWDACVADGGCEAHVPGDNGWGRGRQPVINVSFEDALLYVSWLGARTGANYALPTEAQWAYAAGAGAATRWWWGDAVTGGAANFDTGAAGRQAALHQRRTVAIDNFDANRWGLKNVHGNVAEWTASCWQDTLDTSRNATAATRSVRPRSAGSGGADCSRRVVRGGHWDARAVATTLLARLPRPVATRRDTLGFRVVRRP